MGKIIPFFLTLKTYVSYDPGVPTLGMHASLQNFAPMYQEMGTSMFPATL